MPREAVADHDGCEGGEGLNARALFSAIDSEASMDAAIARGRPTTFAIIADSLGLHRKRMQNGSEASYPFAVSAGRPHPDSSLYSTFGVATV